MLLISTFVVLFLCISKCDVEDTYIPSVFTNSNILLILNDILYIISPYK